MDDAGVPDDRAPKPSVRSRVATARTKAEEFQRYSMERLALESERRGWVRRLLDAYEADRNRGGGLLAGGLAYRFFLWLLPAALMVVSAFGLAASASGEAPEDVARSAGITGAVAATVATAVRASGHERWWLLILGAVLTLWAGRSAVRALQLVSEIAWSRRESTRISGVRSSLVFSAFAIGTVALQTLLSALLGGTLVLNVVEWLVVSIAFVVIAVWGTAMLPHGGRTWFAVLPGAIGFAVFVRLLSLATAIYFAPRIGRVDDLYGSLGVAIVILLWLYLAARAFVGAQFVNATLAGVSHARLQVEVPGAGEGPGSGPETP